MRAFGIIFTLILLYTIVNHYQINFKIRKIENHNVYFGSIWQDPDMRNTLILELLVCALFIPPFADTLIIGTINEGQIYYTLDMIMCQLIFLKSYTLLRVYEHVSMWTNFEAKRISKRMRVETDFRFAFKSDIRVNNFRGYLLGTMLIVLYLATTLYNFERYWSDESLEEDDGNWHKYFNEFQNNLFLLLTTLIGVGIGDAYPASMPGRIVTALGCIAGMFSLAIIIKAMYAKMKMTSKEESAYHLLHQ